jgi:hypothetical protein
MMFSVDQVLILHNPDTDFEIEVVFRGPVGHFSSVVYDKKSGWQGAVRNEWLMPKEQTQGGAAP